MLEYWYSKVEGDLELLSEDGREFREEGNDFEQFVDGDPVDVAVVQRSDKKSGSVESDSRLQNGVPDILTEYVISTYDGKSTQ